MVFINDFSITHIFYFLLSNQNARMSTSPSKDAFQQNMRNIISITSDDLSSSMRDKVTILKAPEEYIIFTSYDRVKTIVDGLNLQDSYVQSLLTEYRDSYSSNPNPQEIVINMVIKLITDITDITNITGSNLKQSLQNLSMITKDEIFKMPLTTITSSNRSIISNNIHYFDIVNHMKSAKNIEGICNRSENENFDVNICEFLKENVERLILFFFVYALQEKLDTDPTSEESESTILKQNVLEKLGNMEFGSLQNVLNTTEEDSDTNIRNELKNIKGSILNNSKMLESMHTKVNNGESRLRKIWWENIFMTIGLIFYSMGTITFLLLPESLIAKKPKGRIILILSTIIIITVIAMKILSLLNLKRLVR